MIFAANNVRSRRNGFRRFSSVLARRSLHPAIPAGASPPTCDILGAPRPSRHLAPCVCVRTAERGAQRLKRRPGRCRGGAFLQAGAPCTGGCDAALEGCTSAAPPPQAASTLRFLSHRAGSPSSRMVVSAQCRSRRSRGRSESDAQLGGRSWAGAIWRKKRCYSCSSSAPWQPAATALERWL